MPTEWKKTSRTLVTIIVIMCSAIGWLLIQPRPAVDLYPSNPTAEVSKFPQVTERLKMEAWTRCHEMVKSSLKAPASASFPWKMEVQTYDDVYSVSSWVDAINSYNAKIRTNYMCQLRNASGTEGDWKIVDFQFDG